MSSMSNIDILIQDMSDYEVVEQLTKVQGLMLSDEQYAALQRAKIAIDTFRRLREYIDNLEGFVVSNQPSSLSFKELEEEVERRGCSLIKKPLYVKFKPCTCGCERRTWVSVPFDGDRGVQYICIRCGKEGPAGRDDNDAKVKWNEMIEKEIENGKDNG